MKLQAFQTFAEQKGFLPSGKMAFGIVEQYPVSLEYTNGNGKRSVMILQFMLKAPLDKAQQKELRGQLAKAAALYVNQGTIRFQITAKDSDVDDQFESVKNTALAFFKQNGLTPISQCPICHGENCDTAAFYAGGYRAVHSQCLHTAMEQVSDAAARNQQNGSYLLGLIGGLLGGIVGIIPSVLTILFMGAHLQHTVCADPPVHLLGIQAAQGQAQQSCHRHDHCAVHRIFVRPRVCCPCLWRVSGIRHLLPSAMFPAVY